MKGGTEGMMYEKGGITNAVGVLLFEVGRLVRSIAMGGMVVNRAWGWQMAG